jgi:hypothetical protein
MNEISNELAGILRRLAADAQTMATHAGIVILEAAVLLARLALLPFVALFLAVRPGLDRLIEAAGRIQTAWAARRNPPRPGDNGDTPNPQRRT